MKVNFLIIRSGARRVLLISGLLAMALTGFLSLPKQAAVQAKTPANDSVASPDALGKLAFERLNFTTGSGNVSLLAVNADGTGQTTLAAAGVPPLYCGEPAFSPDGTKIVYVTDLDIYTMTADGGSKVNLTNNGFGISERNPSWSATNKIVYERGTEIWTMNPDGSNQARFTAISQPSPLAPAWSPDGSKIAFASNGEIWVINADGTNERRVTNNSTIDADPAWSPDGAKIIFGKGASGIAVINLDGTNETNLTNNANDRKPAWSNDGTRIAFVRRTGADGGIFTMDASGANQSRVVADQVVQPGRNENDNPAWQPVLTITRPAQFDFDGDGKSDISAFRPSNGVWYVYQSASQSALRSTPFGIASDRITPADYDGDSKTDIAVFREGQYAYFYILDSQTNTFRYEQFGTTGDVPVPADFDGDGKADVAVYRNGGAVGTQSYFYYRPTATAGVNFRSQAWGNIGDKPVIGDYDGDGKADVAVFRPSNGAWYVLRSSDSQIQALAFGIDSDKPVAADYDGDNKTDYAVYRGGTWYLQRSQLGFTAVQFGAADDVPAPADYDGDGKADIAVVRSGVWYLNRSTAGFTGGTFSAAGDKPVPSAFVP